MKDPNAGKYHKIYQEEFKMAAYILSDYDGQIGWLEHDYQAFYFKTKHVHLIFYPHKTKSTGNTHLRVRSQNSSNPQIAYEMMKKLYGGSGANCTFSYKSLPEGLKYG